MRTYTAAAKRFYNSAAWRKCSKLYAQSKEGLCERCKARGEYVAGQIVHHKVYLNDDKLSDPDIALSFSNLELLCQDCHNKEHHKREPARRYSFGPNGEVLPPPSNN